MWCATERIFFRHVRLGNPFKGNPSMDVPERGITLHQVCIMVASCPSLRCSCRKNLSYTEKQRVWSRSCGLQDLLRNIPFLRCFHVTAAKQWSILMIELLTTVGWKCCQPPGCPCSPNVTTCLSKESIPAIPSRNCKHPLPTSSLMFLRAGFLRFTTTCLCIIWRQLCSKRAAVSTIVTTYHFRPSHPVNHR